MPRHCTVCQSGLRSAIDRELTLRHTVRTVARRYGLSKSSVARHWAHHPPNAAAEAADIARVLADINRLQAQLLAGLPSLGLPNTEQTCSPCVTPASATGSGYALPALPLPCPISTGLEDAAGYTPFRQKVEPVRHPYVPRWLPFRLEREFLVRFREAMQRAQARRRGHWRSHLDEVLTIGRVLGGLNTAYHYGRTSTEWGRKRCSTSWRCRGSSAQRTWRKLVDAVAWRKPASDISPTRLGSRAWPCGHSRREGRKISWSGKIGHRSG